MFENYWKLLNLHLQLHGICSVVALASTLFFITLNALTFMSFVSFGTRIFGDKTLPLPIHLFKLIMNGYYLSSLGFISIRVGLTIHGSSFKIRHLVAEEILKLNNTINRLNIVLYYS